VSWRTFIDSPAVGDHGVQVYDGIGDLAHSVGRFLQAGFVKGAPAIVIATADHRLAIEGELRARGQDPVALEEGGLLVCRDAAETLAGFMDGDLPSPRRFETVVGGLVDEVAAQFPDTTIHAFGEMVDLLWARGQANAALALEELWNELAQTRRFALLCGYQFDIFDVSVQTGALPAVFHLHTHAQPAHNAARLSAAVDHALTDVVGPIETARIYLDVAENVPRRNSMPRGQAVLAWLSEKDTPLAEDVLDRARELYSA
jgi:MEDS: MEthanogen/methylotroph, DcmR Sensory domain